MSHEQPHAPHADQAPRARAMDKAMGQEMTLADILDCPAPASWTILALLVALWVAATSYAMLLHARGLAVDQLNLEQVVFFTGLKINALVQAGQSWRLITSQFVHLDIMHIAFNGYGLYSLGPLLERFYGTRRFLVLYLGSGTLGALCSLYFSATPSGGASGAIYGLVGGLVVLGWKYRGQLPPHISRAFTSGMFPWMAFSLGIGFLDILPMDNAAHLGGLGAGLVLTALMASRLAPRRAALGDGMAGALAACGLAAVAWAGLHWFEELTRCTTSPQAYQQCYPQLFDLPLDFEPVEAPRAAGEHVPVPPPAGPS